MQNAKIKMAALGLVLYAACSNSPSGPTPDTSFNITVRFFDDSGMTAGQKALFNQAAQRIQGIIASGVPSVANTNTDISSCLKQDSNTTILNEVVDDLLIYATVKKMDGSGNVLASAGPCFVRNPGATPDASDYTPVIGQMTFDSDDIGTLTSSGGSLLDVITHEMLHVVGLGTLWACTGSAACRGFVDNAGTTNPQYNAPQARASCVAAGGTVSCATKVPVEGCVGHPECAVIPGDPNHGAGTRDTHWRESTFGSELMTGFLNSGANPLSAITIGALRDLGYTVNTAAADSYTMAAGSIAASSLRAPAPLIPLLSKNWEERNTRPLYGIDRDGNVRPLKYAP